MGGLTLPDIATYYKAGGHQNRDAAAPRDTQGRGNRTEGPETNPHIQGHLIFDEDAKTSPASGAGKPGCPPMKE